MNDPSHPSPGRIGVHSGEAERLLTERVDFDGRSTEALDDLAIGGDKIAMLRLERMSGNHFWGKVYMRDGRELRLSFWVSKRSLAVGAEWE